MPPISPRRHRHWSAVAWVMFDRRMSILASTFKAFLRIPFEGNVALLIGIFANGAVIVETVPFLALPYGSDIRPMGYEEFILGISVLTLSIGLIFSIAGYKSCSKRVNIFMLSLLVAPLPLSVVLFDLISKFSGLRIEQ
jgi:hypothetical protein